MDIINIADTASPVMQMNKGRAQDLGRGSCVTSKLQSPNVSIIASGLPSGVTDEQTVVGSLVGKSDDLGSVSGGGADSGQQHTGAGPGVSGLTKTQKCNLRKKMAKQSFLGTVKASGAVTKRPWSNGSTPSPAVMTAQKKPRNESLHGSFAAAVKTTKLVVVKEGFPTSKLTPDECKLIQVAILVKTDDIPVGGRLPEVLNTESKKGALIVSCGNIVTEEWIRSCFNDNKEVLEDEALRVLSVNDLPKPVKVAFKTKDTLTKDHAVFLRRLSRLNPNLKSEEWRVLQVTVEQLTSRWIFEVEQEDAEEIRKADFGAFTGLDRGIFKILHDPNRRLTDAEEEAAGQEEATSSLVK